MVLVTRSLFCGSNFTLSLSLSLPPSTSTRFTSFMASILANLPPVLFAGVRQTLPKTSLNFTMPSIAEKKDRLTIVAKATSESSESSLTIVKTVQNVWDKPEDRLALIGFGFAGIVAYWTSLNLVTAIDKLPLLPSVFELVGILYSTWFVYRYLLFKPDRGELYRLVNKSIADILGQ
ncbi:protein CURVATURE THYLAKOID 1C, chloroplastic [Impatiens glandulifera]|uniref:protein CURVATURE THYLAKOID 1C, chloroplastic n=1 Tax=Impatiens glandulifera TaxID=253017 RepID=UPI001FB18C0D|nr:protein CURVATURE THYLAKOID 1C, chloroplastic [Impatiens glandulifera]